MKKTLEQPTTVSSQLKEEQYFLYNYDQLIQYFQGVFKKEGQQVLQKELKDLLFTKGIDTDQLIKYQMTKQLRQQLLQAIELFQNTYNIYQQTDLKFQLLLNNFDFTINKGKTVDTFYTYSLYNQFITRFATACTSYGNSNVIYQRGAEQYYFQLNYSESAIGKYQVNDNYSYWQIINPANRVNPNFSYLTTSSNKKDQQKNYLQYVIYSVPEQKLTANNTNIINQINTVNVNYNNFLSNKEYINPLFGWDSSFIMYNFTNQLNDQPYQFSSFVQQNGVYQLQFKTKVSFSDTLIVTSSNDFDKLLLDSFFVQSEDTSLLQLQVVPVLGYKTYYYRATETYINNNQHQNPNVQNYLTVGQFNQYYNSYNPFSVNLQIFDDKTPENIKNMFGNNSLPNYFMPNRTYKNLTTSSVYNWNPSWSSISQNSLLAVQQQQRPFRKNVFYTFISKQQQIVDGWQLIKFKFKIHSSIPCKIGLRINDNRFHKFNKQQIQQKTQIGFNGVTTTKYKFTDFKLIFKNEY